MPILVEGERLRPNLTSLLELADYVSMSAKFPQVPPSPASALLEATPPLPHSTLQLSHGIMLKAAHYGIGDLRCLEEAIRGKQCAGVDRRCLAWGRSDHDGSAAAGRPLARLHAGDLAAALLVCYCVIGRFSAATTYAGGYRVKRAFR